MFSNSGAEANEAMLKIARRWFWTNGEKDRYRVIAFDNAFHGRTMGALAMTGTPKYKEGFGPPLEGVTHVAYGDIAAVRAAMGKDVHAVIVEPIQGEGGVLPPPEGFLKELRALTDEHGHAPGQVRRRARARAPARVRAQGEAAGSARPAREAPRSRRPPHDRGGPRAPLLAAARHRARRDRRGAGDHRRGDRRGVERVL